MGSSVSKASFSSISKVSAKGGPQTQAAGDEQSLVDLKKIKYDKEFLNK